MSGAGDRRWHGLALAAFVLGAVFVCGEWFRGDRMPAGDFPGYAADVQMVRDALLEHGRVPRWCVECYGGRSRFTPHTKEYLAFPFALATDPITATQLVWVLLRVVSALGIYVWAVRALASPPVGIVAGYAYAFGAVPSFQASHLDMALAAAVLPFFWIALVELFRSGRWTAPACLGALTSLLFSSNWVYASVTPFAAVGALALRPWPGRRLAPGWVARSAAALGFFAIFSASHLAWLAADSPHHWLQTGEDLATQRGVFVERSPFLFLNRAGWLSGWLAEHQPPGFDLPRSDGDRRYLGAVVLAVSALGAALAPAGSALRRIAGTAAALFLFQYWLALGPRTLLWEVATSFGVGEAGLAPWRRGLRAAAALCVATATFRAWRRRRGAAALAIAGLLLFFPTASLWSALSSLPPLAVQRSPGHFFDLAHFWLCLIFGSGLAALAARLAIPARRAILLAAVAAALVLDFAPSRRSFVGGAPMAPLREAAKLVAGVEGEGGTLRMAQRLWHSPLASWVITQAEAGHAWGWLPWKAGPAWAEAFHGAVVGRMKQPFADRYRLEPDTEALAAHRIRYFLLPRQVALPAPWRRVGDGGPYILWQQPQVAPMASGLREADASEEAFPVAWSQPGPERMRLDLDAGPEPGWVRVNASPHPWWRAQGDGVERPVRALGAGMLVEVGPGPQRIEMRFDPPFALDVAGALSAAAWIGLGGWLLFRLRPPRKSGSPTGSG